MTDVTPPNLPYDSSDGEAAVIYRRAGTVTFFNLLSRILGMVRDLTIAHKFGATGVTDAWVQAFRIPNALRRLTGEGSMTIAFVPIYVGVSTEKGKAAAVVFARKVLGIVLLATIVLAALGMTFNELLTLATSPGFADEPEKFALSARLLAWTFPFLVLVSIVAWAMGVLNSEHRFAAPAAASGLLNLGIIGSVLGLSGYFDVPVMSIAAGVLMGGVAQVLLQVPSLRAVGCPPLPLGGWNDPDVRRLFRLLLPSLFGVAVYEINVIGLGIIGSFLPSGQIFHFNNATRLEELVMGLFTFAFTMAGLPTLSEHHAKGNWRKMGDTLRLTFSATFYIVLPAMAGLAVAGNAVVAMLYLHGAFGYADVLSTAGTLRVLVLGMPAVAAVRVMVPVFYAMGNARKPVIASTLTMLVTIALGWYLSGTYQVRGLAAGLALGTWFQCALLVIFLRPLAKKLAPWFSWSSMLRQMVAALVVAGGAYWVQGHGVWERGGASLGNWGVLLATVGGGMVVYLGITLALREPEARNWLALVLRIVGRSASPASKSTASKSTSSKSK